jgi:hypothetical protein
MSAALGVASWPAPRAHVSSHALSALGALCLKAFLAAQFVSLTRLFFIQRLGDGFAAVATQAGLLSVALLLPAVVAYGLEAGSLLGHLAGRARAWAAGVLGLTAVLLLYGWLVKGYSFSAVAHDTAPYLVIVAAVILGSMPRVWRDLHVWMLVLFAAALAVNAVGMTEMTYVVSEAYAEDRAGVSTVAYRTQGALAFWPLLLLTARARKPRAMALVFAGVFFVLAQQVLFQKRAPTLRVALCVLVFLLVMPRLWARGSAAWTRARERQVRLLFLGAGAAALAVALTLAPWLFQGQLAGLVQRLSGGAYAGGPAAMLTWENERFFEAGMFLETLQPQELVLGRGFGGYFVPEAPGWGVWLDDLQEFGRRQLHVGLLMPFFKGGLALALVYYPGLLLALARGWRGRSHPWTAAAFFVVLLHALFLLQEGWFIMSVSFDLVTVGLCMGWLLSRRSVETERRA